MDRGRVHWDDNTTKIFLDLCIAEKEKLNYNSKGLTKIGWHNLYRNFKEKTRRDFDTKQLQNKFNSLKRVYNSWRQLKDKTRDCCNKNTGSVTKDADLWENQAVDNSKAKKSRGKMLAHVDALTILFGSMGGEDSTTLSIDGTGGRTPVGGREDYRARMSEDNIGWSEDNVGRSSVGRVSQWSSKEHAVDGPQTKKTKSMDYYVERMSESMLERSRNESSAIRLEQEVAELLRLVEKDGVSQGSELFFIATELFRSPTRRAAFRCITTPKNRIAWLRWTWDNAK